MIYRYAGLLRELLGYRSAQMCGWYGSRIRTTHTSHFVAISLRGLRSPSAYHRTRSFFAKTPSLIHPLTAPHPLTMPGLDGAFLCLGNPLLDISSKVDAAFLQKYDVSATHLPTSRRV